jgi:hypothetical protein
MSTPPACTPPTIVPIFDPTDFASVAGQYVDFPVAQGNLTLLGVACSGLVVNGSASAQSLTVSGAASATSLNSTSATAFSLCPAMTTGLAIGAGINTANTITIGAATASVRCANIDLQNNAINNATTATSLDLLVGNKQTTGHLYLGTDVANVRTSGQIYVGAPLTPNYSALPTATQVGYTNTFVLSGTNTTSATANTPLTAQSYLACPIGTWLYEITFVIATLSVGRVLASLSPTTNLPSATYIIGGGTTTAGMVVRLSAVIQSTAVRNLYLVCESSTSSVSLTTINATRTRIA